MAEATYLPYHFVDHLKNPGIACSAGSIALEQYLCKTLGNGGNDSADSLYKNLRWFKDNGTGPTLNTLAGGMAIDLALKGQGAPGTFAAVWNFMIRNREQMKKLQVEACAGRDRKNVDTKVVIQKGSVYDLYFKGKSDKAAIEQMIEHRFFGIDCIGFAANYLIYNGEWNEYKGATPEQWPMWHCKTNISRAADVKACDFLVWDGHIALVDWVWSVKGDTVTVDVCQSSGGGGPQCNLYVELKETSTPAPGGRRLFKIANPGRDQPMPVQGHCYVQRRDGFYW